MFRRRQAQTHRRQMRNELVESLNHLRLAASHGASGTANYLGPRYDSARSSVKSTAGPGVRKANKATAAAVMPLAIAIGRNARKGKAKVTRQQTSTRRWPVLLGGLLAAGAAVGAAGAVIARRRANRDQWEEYGSTRSTGSRTESMIDSAKSTLDTGRDKVQSLAESAKERAAEMTGSSSSRSSSAQSSAQSSTQSSTAPSSPTSSPQSSSASASPSVSSPEFGSREDLYGKAGSNGRP
jgi:hypothetical protein